MANQIIDNRNLVDPADADTNYVSSPAPGGSSVALDNEVFIEGTGAIGEQMTNTRRGIAYNYGATQDLSNQVWYVWVNCGVVGALVSQASGGFTCRFTGPAIGDFFEVYVGGNDSWPIAVAGGWVQFAIDMDLAKSLSAAGAPFTATGGTAPAVTAIQHVGITAQTTAMTKGVDNAWMDAHWLLPKGQPGILVEGVAVAGSPVTPWTFADVFTQLGQSSGAFKEGSGGSFVINTPIQLGVTGSPAAVNSFEDLNSIILWDSQQFLQNNFYNISAASSGGNNNYFILGSKAGAGTAASGSQGGVIAAAENAVRWDMDFTDTGLTTVGIYGASLIHSGDLQLDNPNLEAISTLYIDGTRANVSDSTQLRISVVNANVGGSPQIGSPVNSGYMYTNDLSNISRSNFQYTQGHGIVITPQTGSPPVTGSPIVPNVQASTSNTYVNYGANNTSSAAVYNADGKIITLNSSGDSGLTVRTTSNIIVVADPVTTLVNVIDAVTGLPIQDARVWLHDTGSPITTYIFGAMGTLTDVNGQVSDSRVLGSDLTVTGWVRRATQTLGSPLNETRYKTGNIVGTISNSNGLTVTAQMIPDE